MIRSALYCVKKILSQTFPVFFLNNVLWILLVQLLMNFLEQSFLHVFSLFLQVFHREFMIYLNWLKTNCLFLHEEFDSQFEWLPNSDPILDVSFGEPSSTSPFLFLTENIPLSSLILVPGSSFLLPDACFSCQSCFFWDNQICTWPTWITSINSL